jgi:hypothetical protein
MVKNVWSTCSIHAPPKSVNQHQIGLKLRAVNMVHDGLGAFERYNVFRRKTSGYDSNSFHGMMFWAMPKPKVLFKLLAVYAVPE